MTGRARIGGVIPWSLFDPRGPREPLWRYAVRVVLQAAISFAFVWAVIAAVPEGLGAIAREVHDAFVRGWRR